MLRAVHDARKTPDEDHGIRNGIKDLVDHAREASNGSCWITAFLRYSRIRVHVVRAGQEADYVRLLLQSSVHLISDVLDGVAGISVTPITIQ